ncbi:unnamed protein product, partial [Oppiella nova]
FTQDNRSLVQKLWGFGFTLTNDFSNEMFATFIANNKSLKCLRAWAEGESPPKRSVIKMMTQISELKQLRELDLYIYGNGDPMDYLPYKWFAKIGAKCRQLKRFTLLMVSNSWQLNVDVMNAMKCMPRLRRLYLGLQLSSDAEVVIPSDMFDGIYGCKRLTHLSLNVWGIHDTLLNGIEINLRKLQSLIISSDEDIGYKSASAVVMISMIGSNALYKRRRSQLSTHCMRSDNHLKHQLFNLRRAYLVGPFKEDWELPFVSFRPYYQRQDPELMKDGTQYVLGSGFIVHPKGLVVTSLPSVGTHAEVMVRLGNGDEVKGRVVTKDNILAVIELEKRDKDYPSVDFADSDALQVGDEVLALTDPRYGIYNYMSDGRVTDLRLSGSLVQKFQRMSDLAAYDYIIHTALSKANGSALLNRAGQVLGMNCAQQDNHINVCIMVTSMTRMRDNFYFLSTYDKRFWFISESDEANDKNSRNESDEANDKNSRKLDTITTNWLKIDASLYYGLNAECGLQFRDSLVLVNYNEKSQQNEILYGNLRDWKWTSMVWSQFEGFKVTETLLDWKRSIDGIAIIEETLFLFQDNKQIRVDCLYKTDKWVYEVNTGHKNFLITGPFNATYFGEQQKDTIPLYIIKGDKYHICYLKMSENVMATCDPEDLSGNSLIPKPQCVVKSDPNKALFTSLMVQLFLLFMILAAATIFANTHLINMWSESDSPVEANTATKPKNTAEIQLKSPVKPPVGLPVKQPVGSPVKSPVNTPVNKAKMREPSKGLIERK